MIAITTKFHGPTNTKGSRITAKGAKGQQISIGYHSTDANTDEARHHAAAKALCAKMGWTGTLIGGSTEDGYVFVFLPQAIAQTACNRLRELIAMKVEGYPYSDAGSAEVAELSYYFTVAPQA